MIRKKEFDEMTLITEESTINEPPNMTNMAKKEEYLRELHRQINGPHNNSQNDPEFQFYPGKTSNTDKAGTRGNNTREPAPQYRDEGIGIKKDSVMTETIDGTVNAPPEQASVTEQLDQSQSRFGGSLVDESFAAAARANMLDQDVAQSQQQPSKKSTLPIGSGNEVDFQNSALPIETEPASPKITDKNNLQPLNNTAKVIKQRPFLRPEQTDFTPEKSFGKQLTQNTPLHIQVPYDEEEDIIEQTFGIGEDNRNNQVFQDLPTPKSRMKREIDIEKDLAAANANSGNLNRKKVFDDGKRLSEHKVTDTVWDVENNPQTLTKNQLYAASQKNIDTTGQQAKADGAVGTAGPPGSERVEPHETPVDVQNLASYFDQMQVGKRANATPIARPSQVTNTIGSSEQKGAGQRQHQSRKTTQRVPTDPNDFNNMENVPSDRQSPEKTQLNMQAARARGDSSENNPKAPGSLIQNSKQATKYQVPINVSDKASIQGSRTGSPQKKLTLTREAQEAGLQISQTPALKDPQKNLGLKTKLEQALKPGADIDATTKKMIIGYQQLKRRKQAQSGESPNEQINGVTSWKSSERMRGDGVQDSEKKELESVMSSHGVPTPEAKINEANAVDRNQALTLREQNASEQEPPTRAQFQVGIVGYREKRQKSDLENELEASVNDHHHGQNLANMTEAFNTKYSGSKGKHHILQNHELDIDERVDQGIASDFEGNFTQDINGGVRTRKLYSQQKRGTRKKILASALKKNKEFKEKTNTIEHTGGISRGLDSQFKIEGRRLMDQIEIDNQSGGTQGNLLHNVDDLADGFNGSNFDVQSVHGYSQNQYAGGANMPYTNSMMNRVLSQNESNQQKRLTQMHQYQIIKGAKQGYFEGQNWDARPLSHGQNQIQKPGEYPLVGRGANETVAEGPVACVPGMLNSMEMMREEYLHELPKSINIHSNSGSARQTGAGANGKNEQVHHDVSFKEQKSKPIPAGKPRLESLPPMVLVDICKYLKPAETLKLTMTAKKLQNKADEPEFESLWVLFSFQTIFSKTGLSGIRNAAQKRIDEALHQMHFQCESIRRDSKEVQVGIFEKWVIFSSVIVFISLPTLLIMSNDFDFELSKQIILLPMTVSWGCLMIAQLYAWYRVNKYHKRVITLHLTSPKYMIGGNDMTSQEKRKPNPHARPSPSTFIAITKEFFQRAIRGRNSKHCSLYTFGSFINRFAMMNMIGLTFMYLGFFLKIYLLNDTVTYLKMAPISVGPLILMYLYEMCTEVSKDRVNWKQKNAHVSSQMAEQNTLETLQTHKSVRRKINLGLIPNFILFTAYHAGFFSMLCMRLDGTINTSYFIILIPLWIFLLYLSTFLVVSGLASTNQRVSRCERITLSVLVPIGFILSIILGLTLVDGYATYPIYVTFIPLLASIIFSYLYVRCLIKPGKGDFVKVKPEVSLQNLQQQQQEISPQRFQGNSIQIAQQLAVQMNQMQQNLAIIQQAQNQAGATGKTLGGGQSQAQQIGQGSGAPSAPFTNTNQVGNPTIIQANNNMNASAIYNGNKPPLGALRTSQNGIPNQPAAPGIASPMNGAQQQQQSTNNQNADASQQLINQLQEMKNQANNNPGGNQSSMQPQFQVKHAFY